MSDTTCASRDNESPEDGVVRIARRQHGVFSRAQAIEAGLTSRQVSHRVANGRWEYVLPSVIRVAGGVSTSRQAAMAAALWAGTGSLVSHGAAGSLWGLDGVRTTRVEVWVLAPRNPRTPEVTVHRGKRLDRADRTVLDNIPITTVTRTIIDLSGRLEDDALLSLVEASFRSNATTPERLWSRLVALQSSGRVGGGRLRAILESRPDGARPLESRLEAIVWRLLDASDVDTPVRQHWVFANGNRYRLDFAWPHVRVAVECDGWDLHGRRERFELDETRRADLASIGWRVLPVTWRQATTAPHEVVARVRGALRAA